MRLIKEINVDITIEDIVNVLRNSDDQAKFINAMADKFNCFSYGDRDGMQMLHIKDELTEEGKAFIEKLNEYIKV